MTRSTVRIVPRSSGDDSLGTAGLARFEAFADEGRWVGYTTTVPGVMSGWHHHGENDTYFYMVTGTIDLEFGSMDRSEPPPWRATSCVSRRGPSIVRARRRVNRRKRSSSASGAGRRSSTWTGLTGSVVAALSVAGVG